MGRALTPKTTLYILRKDAKRWLKALRSGDAKAKARLAAAWPKAPAEPGLRDVQQALALEYGRESWADLKAALDDLALDRKSHAERVDQVLRHGWDGEPGVARRILARHPEVARDSLFTAAACGDLGEVERRLAQDPNGAAKTSGPLGWTALAQVAYGRLDADNAVAIARRLVAAGADPNFAFDDGWGNPFKPMTGAIGLGEGAKPSHPRALELVELLIEAGAEPYDSQALYNVSIVGWDTYWYEVLWRRCETQGFLDRWRDPGEKRLGGHKQLSTLDYLLGNAVGQNHLVRAEWLLERGAHADTPHAYTGQPVHVVAQLSGFSEMTALLEKYGAQAIELTGVEAFRAACLRLDETAVRGLLSADPALKDNPGPLLAAAMFGNSPAVRLLLSLGAPAGGLDHEGISPLHRAVQSGSLETVNLLVAAGADVNLRERKWRGTPLSWAAVLGQPHVAERLAPLSRDVGALAALGLSDRLAAVLGAEPDWAGRLRPDEAAPTPFFRLPGDEAAAVEVIRVLLAHGGDPGVRNSKGDTAADVARRNGFEEAADLMEEGHDA